MSNKAAPVLNYLLYGIAFFMPLAPLVSLFAMGAYGFLALMVSGPGAFRQIPRRMVLPVALYVVYAGGMLFTSNTDQQIAFVAGSPVIAIDQTRSK